MTPDETVLLRSFLRSSTNYLEFGSGGSTVLASTLVSGSVSAVDSDRAWLDRVREHCLLIDGAITPELHHVDIGPVGEWGFPKDEAARKIWPNYHSAVWQHSTPLSADLCLVDGRFRVACILQALVHLSSKALIMVHDYRDRQHYHVVEQFCRPVASVGTLCVFQSRSAATVEGARRCLPDHAYSPQ